jgi:hypothetical protein
MTPPRWSGLNLSREKLTMCLFLLLLLFLGPRSVIVIWWFIQPLSHFE